MQRRKKATRRARERKSASHNGETEPAAHNTERGCEGIVRVRLQLPDTRAERRTKKASKVSFVLFSIKWLLLDSVALYLY